MQQAHYYRDEGARARRLANAINHLEARDALLKMAKDYEEIFMDLERGASRSDTPSYCRSVRAKMRQAAG